MCTLYHRYDMICLVRDIAAEVHTSFNISRTPRRGDRIQEVDHNLSHGACCAHESLPGWLIVFQLETTSMWVL